jgi:hypothetical protein
MTKDEALKMAIARLEKSNFELDSQGNYSTVIDNNEVIAICKEALEQPAQEPFGYFKAEPFGWTDCGKDDEGAIALYEKVMMRYRSE